MDERKKNLYNVNQEYLKYKEKNINQKVADSLK